MVNKSFLVNGDKPVPYDIVGWHRRNVFKKHHIKTSSYNVKCSEAKRLVYCVLCFSSLNLISAEAGYTALEEFADFCFILMSKAEQMLSDI